MPFNRAKGAVNGAHAGILQDRIGYLLKRPVDRRTRCAATLPASAIRRRTGKSRGVLWLSSSGIRASFIRGSASSSPTWRGRPSASAPSTISAARQSSGSKRARRDQVDPAVVPFLRGHDAAIYLAVAGTLVRWLPMLHR